MAAPQWVAEDLIEPADEAEVLGEPVAAGQWVVEDLYDPDKGVRPKGHGPIGRRVPTTSVQRHDTGPAPKMPEVTVTEPVANRASEDPSTSWNSSTSMRWVPTRCRLSSTDRSTPS